MKTNKRNLRNIIFPSIVAIVVFFAGGYLYIQKQTYSGIPDLKSTYSVGNDYHMSVVSNSKKIEGQEEFAEQIIRMCEENSFQSIKFNEDVKGFPRSMIVSVYRTSQAIGEDEPVFQFSYEPKDWDAEYDIKSNPECYKLKII